MREFVFPICIFDITKNNKSKITHFCGTGFSIGTEGYFLTANHVLKQNDLTNCNDNNYIGGIIHVTKNGKSNLEARKILKVEHSKEWDISLGIIDYMPKPFFSLSKEQAYGWDDIAIFGFPHSVKNSCLEIKWDLQGKFLKGYITRRLEFNDLPNNLAIPFSYEINFPIPLGMSGSPVFSFGLKHPLVGIALSSIDTEISQYEYSERQEGSKIFSESVKKLEQVGIVARLSTLFNWKPSILKGKFLGDIF